MDRREFIKLAMFSSAALTVSPLERLLAQKPDAKPSPKLITPPDLIGVKNGAPSQMFETGIKALGGMSRFIKKGQMVLVKPNIGWNKTPAEGANTQPDLVAKIIQHCYKAGAKKVFVFDHTCNEMEASYKNSGIQKAVEESNGILISGNDEKHYKKNYTIKGAKSLKESRIHETYMEADFIINVPVLKNHRSARMTAAIKNLMGVVWDRRYWHRNDLHQCIADFPLVRSPHLTVIDAYSVMTQNGPRGLSPEDLVIRKNQIISTDQVLADTAAAMTLIDIEVKRIEKKTGRKKHDSGRSKNCDCKSTGIIRYPISENCRTVWTWKHYY